MKQEFQNLARAIEALHSLSHKKVVRQLYRNSREKLFYLLLEERKQRLEAQYFIIAMGLFKEYGNFCEERK